MGSVVEPGRWFGIELVVDCGIGWVVVGCCFEIFGCPPKLVGSVVESGSWFEIDLIGEFVEVVAVGLGS